MITISHNIIQGLINHAKNDLPIEACGLLVGKDNVVFKHYPLTNIDNSIDHFSFDPKEQFNVLKLARAEGLQIIANYHSHPVSPARPSEEDIRLAYDPSISYIIISLAEDKPSIKSYKIKNGIVEAENIVIEN